MSRARAFLRSPWGSLLVPISWIYGSVAARRRARLAAAAVRLPVPVVSVGNITCGGTGKTPVVEMLARELLRRGRRPAILSRGYRAPPGGIGDEARLLAENLPGVMHYQLADRVAGGQKAIAQGADVLLLDDGFQHVRLARDLDLVLIDALDPFGGGRVLPAGLLREPIAALAQAQLIGITRGGLVPERALGTLRTVLGERCPGRPQVEIETVATEFRPLSGVDPARAPPIPLDALRGRRVLAFAGIGNPEGFFRQLEILGLELAGRMPFPDHHPYRASDREAIIRRAAAAQATAVVTTQKDAVKFSPPGVTGGAAVALPDGAPPWYVLRIECRPGKGGEHLAAALDRALELQKVETEQK